MLLFLSGWATGYEQLIASALLYGTSAFLYVNGKYFYTLFISINIYNIYQVYICILI